MKTRLLILVIVALLAVAGLAGCGPKKGGETQTPASTPTPTGTSAPTGTTTPSGTGTLSVGGPALPDMPVYPGLRQVQKATQQYPVAAGYGKADVRAYETNDSIDKVVDFYKNQMPAKGWVESQWLDTPQFKNGAYTRNNETDIAMIWAVTAEGKTDVILMRASKE